MRASDWLRRRRPRSHRRRRRRRRAADRDRRLDQRDRGRRRRHRPGQLTAQPTANVVVTFTNTAASDADGLADVHPGQLESAAELAISAVDDPFVEGPHTDSITFVTSSTDTEFDSLTGASLTVQIADNDVAGAIVTVVDDLTSESGDTGSFQIALTARRRGR